MLKQIKNFIVLLINKFSRKYIVVAHHISLNPEIIKSGCLYDTEKFNNFVKKTKIIPLLDLFSNRNHSSGCVLTFDDGLADVYSIAFPILLKNNKPFHIFLNNDTIGKPGFLSKEQIKEMLETGLCTLGSHGYTHKDVDTLNEEEFETFLLKSKKEFESEYKQEILSFAYPHGKHTKTCIKKLKKFGYKYAFIVNRTKLHFLKGFYKLPRLKIEDINI